jgi:hypothetical protein
MTFRKFVSYPTKASDYRHEAIKLGVESFVDEYPELGELYDE